MFIISSFMLDLCRTDDDRCDERCERSYCRKTAAKGWQVCRRSRNGCTDGDGTTNNNGLAEQDRQRVWYEDKCQKAKVMRVCKNRS